MPRSRVSMPDNSYSLLMELLKLAHAHAGKARNKHALDTHRASGCSAPDG